jgi:hypothetical protein
MAQRKQDAIDLLTADHRHFAVLFKVFDTLKDRREDMHACAAMIEDACTALRIHSALELEILYPSLRVPADETLWSRLDDAEVKHQTIEALIDKIDLLDPADPMYTAGFGVLAEYVKHHLVVEEKALFPLVRRLKKLDLGVLGALMQARKEELQAQIAEIEDDLSAEEMLPVPRKTGVELAA